MPLSHISDQEISQDEIKYLESEGRDYCVSHGMIYKDSKGNLQHIPFTMFPTPFPQKLFTAAREVQTDFNLLVHKVSQDYEFTKNALSRYLLFVISVVVCGQNVFRFVRVCKWLNIRAILSNLIKSMNVITRGCSCDWMIFLRANISVNCRFPKVCAMLDCYTGWDLYYSLEYPNIEK